MPKVQSQQLYLHRAVKRISVNIGDVLVVNSADGTMREARVGEEHGELILTENVADRCHEILRETIENLERKACLLR